MKILFLYDFPLWGSGSGTYLRNLTQELVRMGHKIGILAPEERRFLDDKIKQFKVEIPQSQIPVFVSHPELPGAKKYSELSIRELTSIYKIFLDTAIEAIANFEPDIIHAHHLSLIAWVGKYISGLKGKKLFITSHGSCLYDILHDKRYLPLTEDSLKYAKAVTVVSGDTRSKIIKTFGKQYAKNLHIIPGGINIAEYPQKLDTSDIDAKYDLAGKKVVLFTGRLISHKGVKYLVMAANDIKGEVFLIGEGPEKPYLESLIAQKKIKNVRLLGYLSGQELVNFYYRADVFVAPSVWDEPLGLTILEAMAARTPVIATRKGGIPLLIKNGQNGFFVKPRNAQQIALTCNKILENDELRTRLGETARKTVEEKFTWKIAAQKFDRLYKKYGNGARHNNKNGKQKTNG